MSWLPSSIQRLLASSMFREPLDVTADEGEKSELLPVFISARVILDAFLEQQRAREAFEFFLGRAHLCLRRGSLRETGVVLFGTLG
jgi:hypothetical protein